VPHAEGEQGTASMMQEVADRFSEALRNDAVDWHMMQRVFVEEG
jgi:hypothetical protein